MYKVFSGVTVNSSVITVKDLLNSGKSLVMDAVIACLCDELKKRDIEVYGSRNIPVGPDKGLLLVTDDIELNKVSDIMSWDRVTVESDYTEFL